MAPVMEVNVHSDFISDITDNGHKTLIAVRSVSTTTTYIIFEGHTLCGFSQSVYSTKLSPKKTVLYVTS